MRSRVFGNWCALFLLLNALHATGQVQSDTELGQVRQEMEQLKQDYEQLTQAYEQRFRKLDERLKRLEATNSGPAAVSVAMVSTHKPVADFNAQATASSADQKSSAPEGQAGQTQRP